MPCLDEIAIARLLDRSLTADESARVIAHLDECRDCRKLVSALARQLAPDPAHDEPSPAVTAFARAFAPEAMVPHPLDRAAIDDVGAVGDVTLHGAMRRDRT